ncbi:hypothetical protein [Streptomyces sp. Wh19]|uniref:Integral membrane protein n=1 Tax=Streptomyces sanglieri TaxID=193460 RepID=A0ABW2X0C9_9ACTN|nr:hypothetical protein [Streptomyces sp. Wh19]MDV9200599.1 hypothetical protein [Streptomyces sp. Wh19]
MPEESSTGPERIDPIGPVLAVIACALGLALLLGGAGTAVVMGLWAASGEVRDVELALTIAAALFAALVAYVGFGTVLYNWTVRRSTIGLEADGIEAVAEVIEVGPEDVSQDGTSRMIWLRMRLEGPGFPPFEANCLMPHSAARACVGARIEAVVDPGGNTFRV